MLLLHEDRRRGLHVLARTLLVVGILLLASTLLTSFVLGHLRPGGELTDSSSLQTALVGLGRKLSAAFNGVLLRFAIPYFILGAGGLVGLHFAKPKPAASAEPRSQNQKISAKR